MAKINKNTPDQNVSTPPGMSMEDMAAFRAFQAARAAGNVTLPPGPAAVGAAQAVAGGPIALTGGPAKLRDDSPDGAGREVYVRDLPTRMTLTFPDGRTAAFDLEPRNFASGKPGVGAFGKLPVKLVDGSNGALQVSVNLPLCKPSTGKPSGGAPKA